MLLCSGFRFSRYWQWGAAGVTSLWGEDEAVPCQMTWDNSIKPTQYRAEPSNKAGRVSGQKSTRKNKAWHGRRGETKWLRRGDTRVRGGGRERGPPWQSSYCCLPKQMDIFWRSCSTLRHPIGAREKNEKEGEAEKTLPCINENSSIPTLLCSWEGLEVWRRIRSKKRKFSLGKRGGKILF